MYKPKIKEEEVQKMDIDPELTTSFDIIQIGTIDIPIEKSGKGPIVLKNQVVTPTQKGSIVVNDHEASGIKSHPQHFLPRWCPPGLTHTQRRKLQLLRLRENREKVVEKQRDKVFNSYRPMVSQGKEWRVKTTPRAEVVKLPEEVVKPPEAVRPADQTARPSPPEMSLGFASSVHMVCDDMFSLVHYVKNWLW
jgi:hypothetical protein